MLFVFLILGVTTNLWSQSSSRLKEEQKNLEQQIANTKVLLEKSQDETRTSLEQVNLINRQLEYREQLMRNIDNQIRSSELKIEQKEGRINELNQEIEKLKDQYAKLLLLAYKQRSEYGNLMYIFSASTIEEALKRKVYLEKLAEIQKKQMRLIQQHKILLGEEIEELNEERKNQVSLIEQKKEERAEILKAKKEAEEIYRKLKEQEDEILRELREQELQRERLNQEIAAAIQKEIAEEQARIEKAKKEAEAKRKAEEEARRKAEEEARRKAEAEGKTPPPVTKPDPTPPAKEVELAETAASNLIGQDFASNKGRLPWPVAKGTITVNYGKNQHPTLPNVFTQNNGIDITTTLNANVLAVFKGEVTSVINIPGAGMAVIIKHGTYRTVYANLQNVYVSKGDMIETKSPIGVLLPSSSGNTSVVHFEVHQTSGNTVTNLNPNLWLAK